MTPGKPDKYGDDLSAYLDGELPEDKARQVERWLAESDECRQTLEQLRQVSDQLGSLPRYRAPDQLTSAMRLAAERKALLEERRTATGGRALRICLRLTAAAAVMAACVLAGWQAGRRAQPPVFIPEVAERPVRQDRVSTIAPRATAEREAGDTAAGILAAAGGAPPAVREESQVASPGELLSEVSPETTALVEVDVMPSSHEEYDAMVATLAQWTPGSRRAETSRSASGLPAAEFLWNTARVEAVAQLNSLEQQFPGAVQQVVVTIPAASGAQVEQVLQAARELPPVQQRRLEPHAGAGWYLRRLARQVFPGPRRGQQAAGSGEPRMKVHDKDAGVTQASQPSEPGAPADLTRGARVSPSGVAAQVAAGDSLWREAAPGGEVVTVRVNLLPPTSQPTGSAPKP